MGKSESLGLVVIGYHSDGVWESFFTSLRASHTQPADIVVVENSPEVSPLLKKFSDFPITVVHRSDNPGYGAAANAGVAALPPHITEVVICNPDLTMEPEALGLLLEELNTQSGAGVVGPRILTSRGETYPSARAIPGIRIGIGHALLGRVWRGNPWSATYLGRYGELTPHSVGWLSGAFLMVKRDAFESLGGFDEAYFMFFEDVDLGFRLKKSGYRSFYIPAAEITHSGAHATKTDMPAMIAAHHRSAARFLSLLYVGKRYAPLRVVLKTGLKVRSFIAYRLAKRTHRSR